MPSWIHTPKAEAGFAGSDALSVLPATVNLTGPFAPVSDSTWLTITGVTNGVVSFAFTANFSFTQSISRTAHITLLGRSIPVTQAALPYFSLGTTNLVEGSPAGSDSVLLAANGGWTATTNATWLHLSAANQSGTGSTNVIFTFDANPGTTRTGTLTIANQTVTITQAGSTYVATNNVSTLVSSGLSNSSSVAVDGAGNVYIADSGNNVVKELIVASNTVATIVSSGLSTPNGVAVDGAGNVYFADSGHNAIKEWIATSNTVTSLVSSGLSNPHGVAVDGAGNVYFADFNPLLGNGAIKEWIATSNTVTTLVSSGLSPPFGVAVDAAGNVYIADTQNNAIKKWTAVSKTVTTLVPTGLSNPHGVVVDGAGNVYIADTSHNAIKEWIAASNTVTTLVSSGLSGPFGVAVDGVGNVYIADTIHSVIKELPRAFVDSTPKFETVTAVSDALPVVVPATANLTGPFVPVSDSTWLTITGVINGVVSFALPATATNRTAHINLLGRSIPVTQPAVTPPVLTGFTILNNGAFQFGFTNNQGASFTVWTTTNLLLPLTNWTVLGTLPNDGSGQYQFTDLPATNGQQFYRVSSP